MIVGGLSSARPIVRKSEGLLGFAHKRVEFFLADWLGCVTFLGKADNSVSALQSGVKRVAVISQRSNLVDCSQGFGRLFLCVLISEQMLTQERGLGLAGEGGG